jgi:XRE family transcriptional regulator, regulator of sulfur utilization
MITRRDVAVAVLASCATLAGVVGMTPAKAAQAAPAAQAVPEPTILGPTVFHWKDMVATKNAYGEVRSLVRRPTATLQELEMHVTTLNPGQTSHAPHQHVNEELIVLREGELETLSDGKWLRLGPGSIIFNASNSLHGVKNVGTTPATYHVINWSPTKPVAAGK